MFEKFFHATYSSASGFDFACGFLATAKPPSAGIVTAFKILTLCIYYMYNNCMYWSFEWDVQKELENISKHKVMFREAIEVFADPDIIHLEDEKHSSEEDRYYAVGKTLRGSIITVRYTVRGKNVRIFGAAKWRKWRKFYEKEKSRSK